MARRAAGAFQGKGCDILNLSRRIGQEIIVTLPSGELVTIQVVDIAGDKCRIGVTAPRHIGIDRSEVWEANRRALRAAAEGA